MKAIARTVSGLALLGTMLPPLLFFGDRIGPDALKTWMLLATVAWFVATPLWMERSSGD